MNIGESVYKLTIVTHVCIGPQPINMDNKHHAINDIKLILNIKRMDQIWISKIFYTSICSS